MHIVSIDCDLHRVCGWSNEQGPVVVGAKDTYPLTKLTGVDLFLYEIASPIWYGDKIFQKKLAWYIFNSAEAASIDYLSKVRVLYAPSNVWTNGYNEEARHAIAAVSGISEFNKRDRHDLGECQAMLYFYNERPDQWKPFHQYMEEL